MFANRKNGMTGGTSNHMELAPPDEPNHGMRVVFEVSARQEALMEELYGRERHMGVLYHGALRVLSDNENPDRLSLAAHNLRELLQRIPDHIGVKSKDRKVSLKQKVNFLVGSWSQACKNASARKGPNYWDGLIDRSLLSFLANVEEFVDWYAEHIPKRRAVLDRTLRELDEAPVPLPGTIQQLRIDEWETYHNFFVRVAHHSTVSDDEFASQVYALEQYLLDRLRPKTFEEIREIDDLITEGEGRD